MNISGATTRKQRRVTRACDLCHKRGIKCKRAGSDSEITTAEVTTCITCVEYGQRCTLDRQLKKRGTKARARRDDARSCPSPTEPDQAPPGSEASAEASFRLNDTVIDALLEIYLDTIHPAFPWFCERDIWLRWRADTFPKDDSERASMLSMCALSAHHAQHGALFDNVGTPLQRQCVVHRLRDDAVALTIARMTMGYEVEAVRSAGLLALLGIQSNDYELAHRFLDFWHSVSSRHSMHDESRWLPAMTNCDRELQRRIYWSFYRLEIHMACITGQMVRAPEAQANVGYPEGTHHPAFVPGRNGHFEDWFSGWNHTTDLYRILEHVLVLLRMRRATHSRITKAEYDFRLRWCLEKVSETQIGLQPQFSQAFHRSQDSGRNRCGFQTANIFGTLHLVKTIASVLQDSSFQNVLLTASNMLEVTRSIPAEYYRAIGSPLLQKLTGVVYLLTSLAHDLVLFPEDVAAMEKIVIGTINLLRIGQAENKTESTSTVKLKACLAQIRKPPGRDTALPLPGDSAGNPNGVTVDLLWQDPAQGPGESEPYMDDTHLGGLPNMVSDICETLPDDLFATNGLFDPLLLF